MKKKELKQHIRELESERNQAKSNEDIWKDMVYRFIDELKNHGVKAEIVFDHPMIEYVNEDGVTEYMPGLSTVPPEIKFDFSKRDAKIRAKMAIDIIGGGHD